MGHTDVVREVAPVINTKGMQVADVKDAQFIHELPLNGRQVTSLFALTPGVEGGGSPRGRVVRQRSGGRAFRVKWGCLQNSGYHAQRVYCHH